MRRPGLRDLYRAVIESCVDLTVVADALDAEVWVGANVNALRTHAPTAEDFHAALLDLCDEAERAGRLECLVLLRTMAVAGPTGLADAALRAAERVARRLREPVVLPPWIDLLGEVSVGECYLWTDVYGEFQQVYCEFTHRDGSRRHGLVATVDLAFHGVLAGLGVVTEGQGLDRVVKDMKRDARRDGGRFAPIDRADACARLGASIAAAADPGLPKLASGPQADQSLYAALPMAVRRVATMSGGAVPVPAGEPVAARWTPRRREALVEEFVTTCAEALPDPALARMVAARIVDASADVLGWPPDRIGQASVARLFGEVLPSMLVAPDVTLRAMEPVAEAWIEWRTESRRLPAKAHKTLRRTTFAVLMLFPRACRDRRFNPDYPYVADLPADLAGGEALQEVLDRRSFAVPFPGRRGDGVVELAEPAGGLPAGTTHLDELDAADPAHRQLIAMVGFTAAGVHRDHMPSYLRVVEQMWNNEPASVWPEARRLTATGTSRLAVLRHLAG